MRRLANKCRVAVDRAVAPLGLTHAQYSLVASLYGMQRAGERPSQRRLADHTGLEALYVSKLARASEAAGLVDGDRLRPTDAGRELIAVTAAETAPLTGRIRGGIPAADLAAAGRALALSPSARKRSSPHRPADG
ncbi:MarR family transcriptional regulator [Streptomyces sp. NPDC012888]|uniref:MarR family transcriptional regulator n=1 Tax=Streptomyces sp. NPDC012888 TaxID=3364855 RepID=UPI0036A7D02E